MESFRLLCCYFIMVAMVLNIAGIAVLIMAFFIHCTKAIWREVKKAKPTEKDKRYLHRYIRNNVLSAGGSNGNVG